MPANQYALAPHLAGLTLEVDPNISEKTAARHIRQLCPLYPGVSDMLVASAVVAHLFSLFEAAGVRPRLVMYLVGPSMIGKTTLARLIGQTYNRSAPDDPHLVNLISTTAAVHNRVVALSDCVCILDDLFPGGTLAESRRREERLSEVIRTTGNGSAKEKMEGKQALAQVPRGVVFATAEYPLTTFSTVARVVTLPMETKINPRTLGALQATPEALSTFWFFFLRWACLHHDKLVQQIRSQFAELRQTGKRTSDMDRVADAHRILTIGMEILTDYMAAVEPTKTEVVDRMLNRFRRSSTQAYHRQKRELDQLQSKSDQNRFSRFLAEQYCSGRFEEAKKKKLGKKYSSVIFDGLLYIRLEDLVTQAQQHFGDPTVTLQAVSAELRRNGLLEMDKSSRSSKKVNGIRYLQVPVDRLEEFLPTSPAENYLGLNFPSNRSINPVDEILSSWG